MTESSFWVNYPFKNITIFSDYITQVGESVDELRKEECTSHMPAIKTFFKVTNCVSTGIYITP